MILALSSCEASLTTMISMFSNVSIDQGVQALAQILGDVVYGNNHGYERDASIVLKPQCRAFDASEEEASAAELPMPRRSSVCNRRFQDLDQPAASLYPPVPGLREEQDPDSQALTQVSRVADQFDGFRKHFRVTRSAEIDVPAMLKRFVSPHRQFRGNHRHTVRARRSEGAVVQRHP